MRRLFTLFISAFLFFLLPSGFIFSQEFITEYNEYEFEFEYGYDFDYEEELLEPEIKIEKIQKKREDFWICFGADRAFYAMDEFLYGANISFGYGTGSSIGIRFAWFISQDGIDALEINFLLRYYFFRPLPAKAAYHGPFVQVMGGPVIFYRPIDFTLPSNSGSVAAGIKAGWRFVLADMVFIEPSVRGGYPYLFGAALTAGLRF